MHFYTKQFHTHDVFKATYFLQYIGYDMSLHDHGPRLIRKANKAARRFPQKYIIWRTARKMGVKL